ncbi:hypothetical protein BC941DRAFT_463613 [Chlamydoabsidia padenii]|nr:hypothetical protein BC941DRAFT_463613 [Chlamydoabsidia padenii]
MTRAGIIISGGNPNYWGNLSEQSVAWLFWALGAGIFVQVQDFNAAHPDLVAQYSILYQIYSNMRDLWEHIIAHYMYAFGGMIMSWAQLFTFRHQVHGPLTLGTKVVFMLGSLVYGLLLAGIAIEFPYGLYVGLIYSIVIGLICVLLIIRRRNGLRPYGDLFTIAPRMVPQFYLGACIVGLVIVIIWIAIFGFKNRLDAGVAT